MGGDLITNFIEFMGLSSHVDPMISYSKFGLFSADSLAIDPPMPFAIQRRMRGNARPQCQTRQFASRRGRPSRPMVHVDEEAIVRMVSAFFTWLTRIKPFNAPPLHGCGQPSSTIPSIAILTHFREPGESPRCQQDLIPVDRFRQKPSQSDVIEAEAPPFRRLPTSPGPRLNIGERNP